MNDKEREVVLKTAELINKERKDLEISNNYLEAQLKNKKNLLDELLAKVAAAQKTFSNLESDISKEKSLILDQIGERRRSAEEFARKSQENYEFTVRERNFLEQEKSNVLGKRVELDNLIGQFTEKMNRLRTFLDTLK